MDNLGRIFKHLKDLEAFRRYYVRQILKGDEMVETYREGLAVVKTLIENTGGITMSKHENMFKKIKAMDIDEFTAFFYDYVRHNDYEDIIDIEGDYCNHICEHHAVCETDFEICPFDKDYKTHITEKERLKKWLLFREIKK